MYIIKKIVVLVLGIACVSLVSAGCNGKKDVVEAPKKEKAKKLVIEDAQEIKPEATEEKKLMELEREIEGLLAPRVQSNESWSVYVKNIETMEEAEINNAQMQAASLIKLYIAGTGYENWELLKNSESYSGETEELIRKMLTISDNDATNTLIQRIGAGDNRVGFEKINAYCMEHGYEQTHIGRIMLAENVTDDNYTSVRDCGLFLERLVSGEGVGAEYILECLKNQERRGKIPSGLPAETQVANKTGELEQVENDVAIIWGQTNVYILCIMSSNLQDSASAQAAFTGLSATVYGALGQ
ncbi:beta-lactamase class A [Lachnospiraceae bacterium PM6-15]|uniref:serine hydrolase n=1 Tax=Ohessyouella blattaphilus TaxID=2949333 RepID=UPI003E2F2214